MRNEPPTTKSNPNDPGEPTQHVEIDAHEGQPDFSDVPWWNVDHLMHHFPGEAWAGLFGAAGLVLVALIGLWGKRAHDRRCLRKKSNR